MCEKRGTTPDLQWTSVQNRAGSLIEISSELATKMILSEKLTSDEDALISHVIEHIGETLINAPNDLTAYNFAQYFPSGICNSAWYSLFNRLEENIKISRLRAKFLIGAVIPIETVTVSPLSTNLSPPKEREGSQLLLEHLDDLIEKTTQAISHTIKEKMKESILHIIADIKKSSEDDDEDDDEDHDEDDDEDDDKDDYEDNDEDGPEFWLS